MTHSNKRLTFSAVSNINLASHFLSSSQSSLPSSSIISNSSAGRSFEDISSAKEAVISLSERDGTITVYFQPEHFVERKRSIWYVKIRMNGREHSRYPLSIVFL